MKFVFLASFIMSFANCLAQAPTSKPDSLFLANVTIGPSWDKSKKPDDQPDYPAHVDWLKKHAADGMIRFGASMKGGKGVLIIRAESFSSARALINEDAAFRSQLLVADLLRLNPFHGGCLVE